MAEKFKIGDIVQLKSGGPKMTIKAPYSDGDYFCQWFAGNKLCDGDFNEESLVLIQEEREND